MIALRLVKSRWRQCWGGKFNRRLQRGGLVFPSFANRSGCAGGLGITPADAASGSGARCSLSRQPIPGSTYGAAETVGPEHLHLGLLVMIGARTLHAPNRNQQCGRTHAGRSMQTHWMPAVMPLTAEMPVRDWIEDPAYLMCCPHNAVIYRQPFTGKQPV